MLLATAVSAGGSSLWAQHGDTARFPKEFRKWAHVKSVLVGSQSAAFATKGESTTFTQTKQPLRAIRLGKFSDGSVIVYDLPETNQGPGNTIDAPARRVDFMLNQSKPYRTAV